MSTVQKMCVVVEVAGLEGGGEERADRAGGRVDGGTQGVVLRGDGADGSGGGWY